jgi:hypothetical protein
LFVVIGIDLLFSVEMPHIPARVDGHHCGASVGVVEPTLKPLSQAEQHCTSPQSKPTHTLTKIK